MPTNILWGANCLVVVKNLITYTKHYQASLESTIYFANNDRYECIVYKK